ncbi:MAG TPA: MATE family efflux transporter [Burkholderiaceae bacterium]|jgi:MATE family multidrug resistance protein
MRNSFRADLRRLVPLAWPVFIGQIAVLAFATVDTFLLARYSAIDLAALAVGAAIYISVFVGLMGVVLAVSPIVGQLFGAGQLEKAGDQLHQAVWLALILSVFGDLILVFPAPLLSIAHAGPEVERRVHEYLLALAFALPPALLFTAYRGFNTAVSRPKAVMTLQVCGLLLKIPLSAVLVWGAGSLPSLGTLGCGIATAIVMWAQCAAGIWMLRRDPFYAQFGLTGHGLHPLHWTDLRALLKLGVPMGSSIAIEVTGFTFMAIFIARLGPTAVAGHELAINLVSMMFMMPMAIGSAAGTLVAQAIGSRDREDARRISNHSMELGLMVAAVMGGLIFVFRAQVLRLYTHDMSIVNSAIPLLLWVWIFHTADAAQTVAANVLRAHHIAVAPVVIYTLAIWGVGIGGGYFLAFGNAPWVPDRLHGASGFWSAATAGLVLAATGLTAFLAWVNRQEP